MWTLRQTLTISLKLLHPYMPFVTEEIFCTLKEMEGTIQTEESIMIADWPKECSDRNYPEQEEAVELMKEAVKAIRNIRVEMNVPPSRKSAIIIVSESKKVREIFRLGSLFFGTLAGASEIHIQEEKTGIDTDAVSAVISQAVIFIPLKELVDLEKEIERLKKEEKRLEAELKRVNGILSNPNFLAKAPEAKLEEERGKLEKYTDMMKQIKERLLHFNH